MSLIRESLKRCKDVNESGYSITDLSPQQIKALRAALKFSTVSKSYSRMGSSATSKLFEDIVTSNMVTAEDVASTIEYWELY